MTMTLVSTVTVGSGGAASIDFTSIPQTGTDLLVVASLRSLSSGSWNLQWQLNSLTGIYSDKELEGTGSSAASYSHSSETYARLTYGLTGANYTASTYGNVSIYLPNYTSATNKSYSVDGVVENNGSFGIQVLNAGLAATTDAVTGFKFYAGGSSGFEQYSTASLYTITKGSGGATVS